MSVQSVSDNQAAARGLNREGIKAALKPIWSLPVVYRAWHLPAVLRTRAAIFNMRQRIHGYPHERELFQEKLGYALDLKHPQSLNQKIVWKKINDRNPLLPLTADKYRVREYIKSVLGDEKGERVLVPLLYASDDPSTIPFDTLPEEYIIKPNHAAGLSIIVTKETPVDRNAAVASLKEWLRVPYSLFEQEWCYWGIKGKVVVEKLLRDTDGNLAQDYKFHVFNGKCKFIHTTPKKNAQRSGVRGLFTPEWKFLDVGWYYKNHEYVDPPPQLAEMVKLAETLAAPFDYVRVDLYNPRGQIYFGELTHYHGNGREPFYPQSFDFEAGRFWDIVPKYWLKNKHAT